MGEVSAFLPLAAPKARVRVGEGRSSGQSQGARNRGLASRERVREISHAPHPARALDPPPCARPSGRQSPCLRVWHPEARRRVSTSAVCYLTYGGSWPASAPLQGASCPPGIRASAAPLRGWAWGGSRTHALRASPWATFLRLLRRLRIPELRPEEFSRTRSATRI